MSLVVLCFPCCVDEQPPPRRRPKIDRSMIGEPMGFKHTGHIGSGEVATGFDIHNVQDQMQSKGGYEYSCNLSKTEPEGLDLKTDVSGSHDNHQSDQSNQNNSSEVKEQGDQRQESQGDQRKESQGDQRQESQGNQSQESQGNSTQESHGDQRQGTQAVRENKISQNDQSSSQEEPNRIPEQNQL